jgi:hypothetical protein
MNATKKVRKSETVTELGKCPSCRLPLYEGSYGSIPLKDQELKLFNTLEERLIICNSCLNNPEDLSPERIEESLRGSKVKWGEEDIRLAVSAVRTYKAVKLDYMKNNQQDPMERSKN